MKGVHWFGSTSIVFIKIGFTGISLLLGCSANDAGDGPNKTAARADDGDSTVKVVDAPVLPASPQPPPVRPVAHAQVEGTTNQFRQLTCLSGGCCCTFAFSVALEACTGNFAHTWEPGTLTTMLQSAADWHLWLSPERFAEWSNVQ